MKINEIYEGNNIDILKTFEDKSIDCCITSPPYYSLRDYGTGRWVGGDANCPHRRMSKYSDRTQTGHAKEELRGNVGDAIYKRVCKDCGAIREDDQVGLEETPEEYIDRLVSIFHEVKRVLKDDGTLWLNIGDSYWGSGSRGFDFTNSFTDASKIQEGSQGTVDLSNVPKLVGDYKDIKNKDLIGIPWMLAFALRKDGWYLRQDIIWSKPNPMPESVKDRCTKSHEYIFLLSKSPKYYFDHDAIQEKAISDPKRYEYPIMNGEGEQSGVKRPEGSHPNTGGMKKWTGKRNKRSVWNITVASYKFAHFATFPEHLVYPMIVAGCPKGGTVLDPFMGSGTVAVVAKQNGRNFVGCELNREYIKIAKDRIFNTTKKLF